MYKKIVKIYWKLFKKKIKRISYIEVFNYKTLKWVKVKAKADTGACGNSMDIEFAKKIGFKKTILDFNSLEEEILKLRKNKKKIRYINKIFLDRIEGAKKIVIVKSAHGRSLRIKVNIIIKIKKRIIKTSANIYDRKNLKIHFLLGQSVLKFFYIKLK